MNALSGLVSAVADYQTALLCLAILCFAVLLQAILTAPLAFASGEQEPGKTPEGDHGSLSFRVLRTHANSVESLPPFMGAVLLAVIGGADAGWVNGLAAAHVAFRLAFWGIYYAGVGKVAGGPRTMAFVGGWFTNAGIAGMAIYALL